MSRMEEYYPQPLEYHPERWLRDDRADMGTTCKTDGGFLSLPFSHGLRACPGKRFAEQSLYLAVATVSNTSSALNSDGIGWFCNVVYFTLHYRSPFILHYRSTFIIHYRSTSCTKKTNTIIAIIINFNFDISLS